MTRVKDVVTFMDDKVLDVPGQPHVIHTPGHTLGETAFFLPNRNVLLSGDTLVTQDLLTGEHGTPQVPHRSLSTDDKLARRSIDRLNELGQVAMLPGHGKPWIGTMKEAVELARSRFRKRTLQLRVGKNSRARRGLGILPQFAATGSHSHRCSPRCL